MNKLLFCLALALVVVSTVAERSKFTLQPMGLRVNNQTPNNHMWMDAKDDLLIYSNFIASPVESAVLRRNNQGVYINVANISMSLYAVTNGKFIASYGEGMTLYSIDENNQLSEGFNLSSLSGGCLFGDNYFVGFENSGDGNDTLRTYQYEATSDSWTEINDGVEIGNGFWQGPQASFYAINNRLIVADTFTDVEGFEARIYELQTDKSWKLTDSFPLNGTTGTMGTVTYNGIDTFVYGLPNSLEAAGSDVPVYGIVYIFTKVNGKWVEQKLTAAGVGYRPISFFGFYNKFVEDGTLIISAAYEGNLMTGSFEGGKILLLTRDSNGVWVPQLDLVSESGIFGSAVALSDTEIIAVAVDARAPNGYYLTFHRTSRCFYKPMNVTCNNQQIDNCSDVEVEELFTLNNPECGSVSSSIRGFSLIDNQAVEAQVMLQKSIGSAVYCNVTVTCPAAKTPTFVSGSEARYLSFAAVALLIMHLL